MEELIRQISKLLSLGDEAAVIALIETYKERDPACYEVGLAALSIHRRDAEACRAHAEAAHRLDFDDPLPLHYLAAAAVLSGDALLAEVYAKKAVERGGSVKSRLTQANLLFTTGKLPEAEEAFRRILRREPHNVEALRGLGITRARLRDYGEAIRVLSQAFEISPEAPAPMYALIDTFAEMGKVVGAIASVRAVLEQKPPDALRATFDLVHLELSRLLADTFPARNEIPGADSVVDAALRSFANRPPRLRLRLAATLIDIARYDEARDLLEKLAKLPLDATDRAQIYYLRGLLEERSEKLSEALAAYVGAVDLDPERGDAACNALAILLGREDDSAAAEIERLIGKIPEVTRVSVPKILLNEAMHFRKSGDLEAAKQRLDRALRYGQTDQELRQAAEKLLTELAAPPPSPADI